MYHTNLESTHPLPSDRSSCPLSIIQSRVSIGYSPPLPTTPDILYPASLHLRASSLFLVDLVLVSCIYPVVRPLHLYICLFPPSLIAPHITPPARPPLSLCLFIKYPAADHTIKRFFSSPPSALHKNQSQQRRADQRGTSFFLLILLCLHRSPPPNATFTTCTK